MKRIKQKMLDNSIDPVLVNLIFEYTDEWEGLRDLRESRRRSTFFIIYLD